MNQQEQSQPKQRRRRGRLKKGEKIVITQQNQMKANEWLVKIGDVYEEYRKQFDNYDYDEDVLNNTIVLCYETIQRNGLEDLSIQGCKNYLFRAYNTNLKQAQINPYTKRKIDMEEDELISLIIDMEDEITYIKEEQLFNDFSVQYLNKKVEENFDTITHWVWRVKWFVPNITYKDLYKITKIKDCRARVQKVNTWLRENIKKEDVKKEFNNLLEIE